MRDDAHAQALARRLDRRYRSAFGDVASHEGDLVRTWSPAGPKRGQPLDARAAEAALREPVVLPGPFEPIGERCFMVRLRWPPHHLNLDELADTDDAPGRSPLVFFEDGRPLSPAHSLIADIRAKGGGRFSHVGDRLFFSASDDSDPNLNGRTYAVGIIADYTPQTVYRWNTVVEPLPDEVARESLKGPVALIGPFQPDGGHGYLARLRWLPHYQVLEALSDRDGAPRQSPLILLEDELTQTSPHSLHVDIRNQGEGRYSHWKDVLYFSSSDNSEPNTNGRTYAIRLAGPSVEAGPGETQS